MKQHHIWIGLASLPLMLGFTACGGEESDGGSGAPQDGVPEAGEAADPEDFCLNSDEEVGAALGVEGVTSEGVANEGLGGGCAYAFSDSSPLYALSVVTSDQAEAAFAGYEDVPGVEPVDGIGDKAIYMPVGDRVGIAWIENGVVVSAAVAAPVDLDEQELRDALAELAGQATD